MSPLVGMPVVGADFVFRFLCAKAGKNGRHRMDLHSLPLKPAFDCWEHRTVFLEIPEQDMKCGFGILLMDYLLRHTDHTGKQFDISFGHRPMGAKEHSIQRALFQPSLPSCC